MLSVKKELSLLCYKCHDKSTGKPFPHFPPTADVGECTGCHDPHRKETESLLKKRGAALCFMCHKETWFKNRFNHGPVAAGSCLLCHDPHGSKGRMLLRKFGSALCFDCHDSSLAKGRSVHEPVAEGNCDACHQVHGSANPYILFKYFPEELYLPYRSENFALCFSCHNMGLAEEELTEKATGFRNGDRNLHYVHINKTDKGRSCKVCHDPHAAGQQKLITEKVPGFGKWEIPIFYTKTDTGGTCIVGCHKPKTYDRVHPVTY